MSFLQSRSKDDPTTSTQTSLAYSSACTAGSTLFAAVYWLAASGTATVTDPTNGTWTAIGTPTVFPATLSGQAFYTSNTGTTALTATLTAPSTTDRGIAIHEYSGAYTLENHTEAFNNATPTPALTLTPTLSTDFVLAWIICGGHVNAGPAGFTLRENTNFGGNGTADDLAVTGGSPLTATWTASNNTNVLGVDIFTPATPAASSPAFLVYGHTGLDRIQNIETYLNVNIAGWLPYTSTGLDRLANIEAFLTSNPVNSVTFLPYGKTGTDRLWNIESYLLTATSSSG